jgi:hypothetical protein
MSALNNCPPTNSDLPKSRLSGIGFLVYQMQESAGEETRTPNVMKSREVVGLDLYTKR